MNERYCMRCGHVLQRIFEGTLAREGCPQCGWIAYPQIKVGAGGLIEQAGRLLLVKRAQEPWKDRWYLPAGFMEEGESPEQTAMREVFEETGLRVKAENLCGVFFYEDDPRGSGLLILYHCYIIGGTLQTTDETLAARFFSPEELPVPLAGTAHYKAVELWVKKLCGRAESIQWTL
jgi:ADP-ribose pyrophosphatase YjhB (NUDIX family)